MKTTTLGLALFVVFIFVVGCGRKPAVCEGDNNSCPQINVVVTNVNIINVVVTNNNINNNRVRIENRKEESSIHNRQTDISQEPLSRTNNLTFYFHRPSEDYYTIVDHRVAAPRFVDHSSVPYYYAEAEPVYVQPVQVRYVDHSGGYYGYCDSVPMFSIGFRWGWSDCYPNYSRFVDHSRSYSRPTVHPPRVETRGTTSRFVDHSTPRSSSSPPSVRTR